MRFNSLHYLSPKSLFSLSFITFVVFALDIVLVPVFLYFEINLECKVKFCCFFPHHSMLWYCLTLSVSISFYGKHFTVHIIVSWLSILLRQRPSKRYLRKILNIIWEDHIPIKVFWFRWENPSSFSLPSQRHMCCLALSVAE